MTKTKESKTEEQTTNGHDFAGALARLSGDVPDDLRRTLEPLLKDIHKTLDPVLSRLESTLEKADLLAAVAERNRVIDDIREILTSKTIAVKEEECLICGRAKGEAHARGTCAATARLTETQDRIKKA